MDEENTIIVDVGSENCRVGFAGDDSPRKVIRSVISKSGYGEPLLGDEALEKRLLTSTQNVSYLIERGKVVDWGDMEKMYQRSFNCLESESCECFIPIMPPSRDSYCREKNAELVFEKFSCRSFYAPPLPGILALYSSGRTTGIVLDCGAGVSSATPIWEGYTINPKSVLMSDISGNAVNDHLYQCISEKGYHREIHREDLRLMKEEFCYVSLDYQTEYQKWGSSSSQYERSYDLPDGSSVSFSKGRFAAPEKLFNRQQQQDNSSAYSSNDERNLGVAELLMNSINFDQHSPAVRRDFYSNVVVSGGTTFFEGFVERLHSEMMKLSEYHQRVRPRIKVNAPAERKFSVWIGASILGSLSTFVSNRVTRNEYSENGASIVNKKCSFFPENGFQ